MSAQRMSETLVGRASPAVVELLTNLDHPAKPDVEAVRATIRGVSSDISEAVQWNAPSFLTHEHFATFNLTGKAGPQLIFHLGAKKRDPLPELVIDDPDGLLRWLGKDRATMLIDGFADSDAKRAALRDIVTQWVSFV